MEKKSTIKRDRDRKSTTILMYLHWSCSDLPLEEARETKDDHDDDNNTCGTRESESRRADAYHFPLLLALEEKENIKNLDTHAHNNFPRKETCKTDCARTHARGHARAAADQAPVAGKKRERD